MASVRATTTVSEATAPQGNETNGAPMRPLAEPSLLDTVRVLQVRTEELEQMAATMRQELAQIVDGLHFLYAVRGDSSAP